MTELPLIPTATIGSMPKPSWLTGEWYSVGEKWKLEGEALEEAFEDATRLAVADQVEAGVDIVCDGEQRRPSVYTYFLLHRAGVDFERLAPKAMRGGSFTQDVPRIVGPVGGGGPSPVEDYHRLRAVTDRPVKVTIPGPLTLLDGVADEHYGDERALAMAFADVINEEVCALEAAGCTMVQLDEPAFTRLPEKVHAFGAEAMERCFAGTTVTSVVHVCYGYAARVNHAKQWKHGYEEIFGPMAEAGVDQYSLELAEARLPASVLKPLAGKTIQVGVVDCGAEVVETPEIVAARLRDALTVLPPERVIAAPDCGLTAHSRAGARAKLRALVEGTAIVRRELAAGRADQG